MDKSINFLKLRYFSLAENTFKVQIQHIDSE